MGLLRDPGLGKTWGLRKNNIIGRDAVSDVRMPPHRDLVSDRHLQLRWLRGEWMLSDLRSTNGTWVNGRVLTPGNEVVLKEGAKISLPGVSQPLELVDAGPPDLFAVHVATGAHVLGEEGSLLLGEGGAAAVLCRDGGWSLVEGEGEETRVEDGAELLGGAWRIHLPEYGRTRKAPERALDLREARLVLRMAPRWEQCTLTLVFGDREVDMGARQPWFVVWFLAERMLKEAQAEEAERGWMDMSELARDLGKSPPATMYDMTLAQRQLEKKGIFHGEELFESRYGQRRVGVPPQRLTLLRPPSREAPPDSATGKGG